MTKNKYSKIVAALLVTPLLIGGVAPMNASAASADLVVTANNNKTTINIGEYTTVTAIVSPLSAGSYYKDILCGVETNGVIEIAKESRNNNGTSNSNECKVKGLKAGNAKVTFVAQLKGIQSGYPIAPIGDITITVTDTGTSNNTLNTSGSTAGMPTNIPHDSDPQIAASDSSQVVTTGQATSSTTKSSAAKVSKPTISKLKASPNKINPGESTKITVKHTGQQITWTITDKKNVLESMDCNDNGSICTLTAKNKVTANSSIKVTVESKNGSGSKKKSIKVTVKKSDLTPEYAEEVATKADELAAQAAATTIGAADGYSPKTMLAALKKAFKKAGYKSKVFTYQLASTGQPAWFGHTGKIDWRDQAMRMIGYRMVKNGKTYTEKEITKFLKKQKFTEEYINYVITYKTELANTVKIPDLNSIKTAIAQNLMSQKGLSQDEAEAWVKAHVK